MRALRLGERSLTLEDVASVSYDRRPVEMSAGARLRVERAHEFLLAEIASGKTLYGVNTGFGVLSSVKIPPKDLESLQVNLLRSHAVGMGDFLSDEHVRAMLLLRAATLAHGHSGVSLGLIEQILALLNRGIIPLVPEQGSVGACGDLAPLAHLALPLIGEGRARYKGKVMTGAQALKAARLKPLRLGPKEGLALINGTQFILAWGILATLESEHLADVADLAGALTLEAMRGTDAAFDPEVHRVRAHEGQVLVADRIRGFLRDPSRKGAKSALADSHVDCGKVQDPYSLRCMPQVHGAARETLRFVRGILERELNSVTDNPLIFADQKKIISGGNFHGEIPGMALDFLAIAIAELGSISEERIAKLVNPALSDLPGFLIKQGGLNSGFMIVQVSAAAIASENKTLCHPATVDSIPTSADKEDHVSMGAWAARKAARVVENSRRILAMELLAGAQGLDLLRPLKTTPPLEATYRMIRKISKRLDRDRSLSEEMTQVAELIRSGALAKVARLVETRK